MLERYTAIITNGACYIKKDLPRLSLKFYQQQQNNILPGEKSMHEF